MNAKGFRGRPARRRGPAVGRRARALPTTVDAFDQAVAEHLGVNRTDLRCLDLLMQHEELGWLPLFA